MDLEIEMNNNSNNNNNNSNVNTMQNSTSVMNTTATITPSNNTRTMTLTETATTRATTDEVHTMTLHPHQRVTWDEHVINNEGLGRKSSKRCCIFQKQRDFGESSSSSSESESEQEDNEGEGGTNGSKKVHKIARKKKIPDYQRYHA